MPSSGVLSRSRAAVSISLKQLPSDSKGSYGSFIGIEPKDFDDEQMQVAFEQIRSRLMGVQQGQIDSVAATCRRMSDEEVEAGFTLCPRPFN